MLLFAPVSTAVHYYSIQETAFRVRTGRSRFTTRKSGRDAPPADAISLKRVRCSAVPTKAVRGADHGEGWLGWRAG